MPTLLADLHAPIDPLLREVIARAGWRRGGLVLDIACGAGLKRALLMAALGVHGRVVGIDSDRAVLRVAQEQHAHTASAWVAGDAISLPMHDSCADGVVCIAALGAFFDQAAALRELRRVLAPGGTALVVTAAQCWSAVHPWPPALAAVLAQAHRQALDTAKCPPSNELCDPLADAFYAAGFTRVTTRAFLLNQPSVEPLEAELAVAAWSRLRPYLVPHVSSADLARADAAAAAPEDAELVPVLLAGLGKIEPKCYLP